MPSLDFPVLAVESDFITLCQNAEELKAADNGHLLFVLDSRHHYFDAKGQPIDRQWPRLCMAVQDYLSAEGHCCVAKLQLQDESQIWPLLDD
ncbi:hypothetical protein [Pseudoalteromonas sp. T1lg48]|uniref:hypothetical protein n=1 Tax=Pseudoalteromonas sp. T1lg48 TaxID=2077100 RepID=UPI000CF6F6BA|nr:hypothetical protein [Pseudoalteromonas sp. T1lg48]